MRKLTLLLALGFGLVGCTTPGLYRPSDGEGRYGYSEQEIEDGRYQVRFKGGSSTERDTVEIYLLFRAAELTQATGNDYFVVVERDVDKKTTYRSSLNFPHRHLYNHYFYYHYYDPFDYGYGARSTVQASERYTATADIVLYKGEKPADNANAYDAKSVIEHLRPKIVRAEP